MPGIKPETSYVQSVCSTTELHPLPGRQQVITDQILLVPPVSFFSDLSGAMGRQTNKQTTTTTTKKQKHCYICKLTQDLIA